jgi:hypothetical protein
MQGNGSAVGQRVGHRYLRVHPTQAVLGQRHAREHRGRGGRRIDRREGVVDEAGQGQLLAAHGAAGMIGGLQDQHLPPGLSQADGRSQSVGAAADDDGVAHPGGLPADATLYKRPGKIRDEEPVGGQLAPR